MINMARNIKSKTAKNGKNANRSLLNPDLDANLCRIRMEYKLPMILQILPAIVLGDSSIQLSILESLYLAGRRGISKHSYRLTLHLTFWLET